MKQANIIVALSCSAIPPNHAPRVLISRFCQETTSGNESAATAAPLTTT